MTPEYDARAVEDEWQDRWVEAGTYAYEGATDPAAVFAIDTPPPTVSGSLHMGHLYGHTLQDFVARFERMRGDAVFFPFGYDDNGIASEQLTEAELGIRHQDFSRREFQEKCREVCREYEADFTEKMQGLAMSIDWSQTYKTIEPRVQRISQLSFLDLYERGREYRRKAPAIWCPDCETAISQVEMEDAERTSHENDVAFPLADPGAAGQERVVISTTRPELLPACVAVFVHPEDEERAHLVGERAVVPLFGHEVPILADERVDREVGTGVVMSCTFGDQTDIEWYQAHDLDLRVAIDESGTMTDRAGPYAGLSTKEAREAIAEDLDAEGYLLDRRPITHTVQVHERSCKADVEYLVTEQWYVKLLDKTDEYLAAGRQMDWYPEKMFTRYRHWIEGLQWDWCISRQRDSGIPFPVWYCADCGEPVFADREDLPVDPLSDDPPVETCPECGAGEFEPEDDVFDTWATSSLTPLINAGWDWHPAGGARTDGGSAGARADVEGTADANADADATAGGEASPATDAASGADAEADAGEFRMANPELYPMDLRPQGHDIISFWLFHTVVKCLEHTGEVPFDAVMINGMVLDENREAMSKSKGNVVVPEEVLAEYPVDAARYWAAGTSIGDDFPFKEKDLRAGERLLQKIWNASLLVDDLAGEATAALGGDSGTTGGGAAGTAGDGESGTADDGEDGDGATGTTGAGETPDQPADLAEIDRWLLAELDAAVADVTRSFEDYAFSKARDRLRSFFWNTFCDDYLEIAKQRVRDEDAAAADLRSVRFTLRAAHRTFVKLFAPIVPHVTEEVWSELYADGAAAAGGDGDDGELDSVHRTDWPAPGGYEADREAGATAMAVISAVRKYKTEHGMALNEPIDRVEVAGDVAGFEDAIAEVLHVRDLEVLASAPETETTVTDVRLDYEQVGPRYGETVADIEAAIEAGEFEIDEGRLSAAGETLEPDLFAVERERRYAGEGEMLSADDAVVVVKR